MMRVGHDLNSCTSDLQYAFIDIPNRPDRIVIVDTPGFDDTYTDDADILRRIAVWLASTCVIQQVHFFLFLIYSKVMTLV